MPLFAILTLFPDALAPYVRESILGLAQDKGLVEILLVDFRDFARDRHRTVDDRPFGGGPGMVLKPEPIADCVEWLEARHGRFRKLVLCPQGRPFRQELARELAHEVASGNPEHERVLLLAGRYEGLDERVRTHLVTDEISIGDYVLTGGELPALVLIDAITRLLPGALGDAEAPQKDSHAENLLEYPHYTRPANFRGWEVPEILRSGHHALIERWRREQSLLRTRERRPDLFEKAELTKKDREFLARIEEEQREA